MKPAPSPSLDAALKDVLESIPRPEHGLPEPVFRFLLKVTPMINVDLLVRDADGRHLLAWREDEYGEGWHIPGGIIRVNETMADRIRETARLELGATVEAEPMPCDVKQFFQNRGHFISLLFRCRLTSSIEVAEEESADGKRTPGELKWFSSVPHNLLSVHKVYAEWLSGLSL